MTKDYEHNVPYNDGWKEKSGYLGFKMSNDYLFRAIMQKDEETLKNVVAAFLGVGPEKIEDVTVTNPIVLGDSVNDKEMHLDVHVILNYMDHLDLEMQTIQHEGWIERSVMYACSSFGNLSHGGSYQDARSIWQIDFCDFSPFKHFPSFYADFKLINTKNIKNVYTDKLRITNVYLTHIDLADTRDPIEAGLVRWARLFKAKTWEELHMLAQESKFIDQAVSTAWQLSEDEKIREQMRRREENEWIWNAHLKAEEEAKAREQEAKAREQEAKAEAKAANERAMAAQEETTAIKVELENAKKRADEVEKENAELKKRLLELENKR